MTLPFVLVASIVLPLILIPTAKRLGGRSRGRGGRPGRTECGINVAQPSRAGV